MKLVYMVHETHDEYGRKGKLIGVFGSKISADKHAEGRGWYGGAGSVSPKYAIEVEGKTYILESKDPIVLDVDIEEDLQKKKEAALAELSPEDRKALGV